MQLALSKPVSRSAALALLLLALLLVHAFVVRPLASSWHDAVDAIQESRALASLLVTSDWKVAESQACFYGIA